MAENRHSSRSIPPAKAHRDGKNPGNSRHIPFLPVIPVVKHTHVRARPLILFYRDKWDNREEVSLSAGYSHPGSLPVPG